MVQTPRQLRVFVVDDHDVIASSLAMILRFQGGFHATSFVNSIEALGTSRRDPPDLLITDVVMPQLSGIELAIQVLEHCRNCKVLLFSGQDLSDSMLETARARGYEFEFLKNLSTPPPCWAASSESWRELQLNTTPARRDPRAP
jgi:DNA-binding NarL/FixJ family response regulator